MPRSRSKVSFRFRLSRALWGFLLVALFAVGAWFYESGWATSAPDATVLVSDDGFEPQRLTIQTGTTVIFRNIGLQAHWPASNFHPTHTLYPEPGGCLGSLLDACRGLAPGESFSFVFSIPGQWPLHDHLFPGLTMIVEVAEDSRRGVRLEVGAGDWPARETFLELDYEAQLEFIKDRAQTHPSQAWIYLKQTVLNGGEVVGEAHEFAHIIGNGLYEREGLPGIKICDAAFAFGCYHGVSEKILQDMGRGALTAIEEQCLAVFPKQESLRAASCIHGLGHGLLAFEGLSARAALGDCQGLSPDLRTYCYDGVFMEYFSSVVKPEAEPADPWEECWGFAADFQGNCVRYQALALQQRGGKTAHDLGLACRELGSAGLRNICFESIGFHAAQIAKGAEDKIKRACAFEADTAGQNICLTAAARETIFQNYEHSEITAIALCESLSADWQKNCLASVEETRKAYD